MLLCAGVFGESIEPGSVVHTDGARVASLLKRWLLGTHQGAVSHEHLDYYLDGFTLPFNRRKSRRGLLLVVPSKRPDHIHARVRILQLSSGLAVQPPP